VGKGGVEEPPPSKPVKSPLQALQAALASSLPQLAAKGGSSEAAAAEGQALEFYPRPFEFLSLGLLAYVGNDKALTQLEAFDSVQVRGGGAGSGHGGVVRMVVWCG
jgi:NADH:ubiquinone reductase (non-electrogenic)